MRIIDPIYGAFELPSYLDNLVETPEFRRLSEIRLLNINSASLAALADVRRYSHTLGVLRLALQNPLLGFGEEEHKAFLASIIIHDAGTPAFAHLFEYFLSDRSNWSHEAILSKMIRQTAHVDGRFQQIFRSQIPRFKAACRKAKLSIDLIQAIVDGKHPLSSLIFGSLDLDNLDNVYRMAFMLGMPGHLDDALALAANLGVDSSGSVTLARSFLPQVEAWSKLRRSVYNVLVFDEKTVAGQAVLSRAISDALSASELSEQDWGYTDNSLIEAICATSPVGKLRLERDFFGRLPRLCLMAQLTDETSPLWRLSRDDLARRIENFLSSHYPKSGIYGYALRDSGTFEKNLEFRCPDSGEIWRHGQRSRSLVLYGFSRSARLKAEPDDMGREFVKAACADG